MLSLQPEPVRRSHWARHLACAVDVLELLAAEFAFTHDEGRPASTVGGQEDIMENLMDTNIALKDIIVKLMTAQYKPGEQFMLAHVCMPNNDAAIYRCLLWKADFGAGVVARFGHMMLLPPLLPCH